VLPRASNLPPLRCLPKPRLPRHYLPPNRVRHKIGTDHLSRPPRVAICSPPSQGRRAAAPRVSGERRVWGRTGRVEGPPTPPVAFAPPATRAARAAARARRTAPPPWPHRPAAPPARAAPTARAAPPRRRPPDQGARPPPASAPPDRTSVAWHKRRGRDGLDAAPTPA